MWYLPSVHSRAWSTVTMATPTGGEGEGLTLQAGCDCLIIIDCLIITMTV